MVQKLKVHGTSREIKCSSLREIFNMIYPKNRDRNEKKLTKTIHIIVHISQKKLTSCVN